MGGKGSGRLRAFTPEQEDELVRLYRHGRISAAKLGRLHGVSGETVMRALARGWERESQRVAA